MATVLSIPGAMSPVARILSTFSREQIAGFIEVAIGLLDVADGDPDLEENGDELDGTGGEDDFCLHNQGGTPGPGCAVSDPDLAADDLPVRHPTDISPVGRYPMREAM